MVPCLPHFYHKVNSVAVTCHFPYSLLTMLLSRPSLPQVRMCSQWSMGSASVWECTCSRRARQASAQRTTNRDHKVRLLFPPLLCRQRIAPSPTFPLMQAPFQCRINFMHAYCRWTSGGHWPSHGMQAHPSVRFLPTVSQAARVTALAYYNPPTNFSLLPSSRPSSTQPAVLLP